MIYRTMKGAQLEILRFMQEDMPLDPRPFKRLAKKADLPEKEIINLIKHWQDIGLLRRLSVVIRHRKTGLRANGMSVWNVPLEKVEEVGKSIVKFEQVGHCYQRETFPGWPYNLFAMIHERSKDEVIKVAKKISLATGVKQYDILFTEKEFKKTSMKYFINEIPMEANKE